ncbi:hypothetical protein AIGOOFII_1959 [Methylobacterium marchantiae]|nr:hypothetical protein ASF25_11815 [Methylobacterium sp. Leaf100]MBD8904979.1 hypothetical protein [Methylobacterium bullatum]GJE17246.1 hypothetical protein AIGOOFII_1959 [Methylobacterium marchantiae]
MPPRTNRPPQGHDFPLDFHWRTKPAFIAAAGVSLIGHPRALEARNSIMTSLVRAALAGQGGWVSYSRSKRFYEPLSRYEGTAYTYDRVKAAVQELLDLGLIEEERALPGPASHGWQSRMRATDRLIAAFNDCPFEHVGPREVIELRDVDGERMAYTDTDNTRRLRKVMEARNEAASAIRIEMPEGDGWLHTPGHVRARSEKTGGWVGLRPTPAPIMVRIYGRGRWDMHGRLYGWWQQLPQARRIELLINGEVAFEEDWSACHPRLLYAMAGKVPVGEIYDVDGYDPRHVKAALLTVMNTRTTYGGILSLMKREEDSPGEWPHSLDYTKGLMKAVTHRHEPIAHFLGADMGVRLMHIESEMCVEVLKKSEKENIPALPVHDSFVTQASKGPRVTAIMADVMDATCAEINPCQTSRKRGFTPHMGARGARAVGSGCCVGSSASASPEVVKTEAVSVPVSPVASPTPRPLRWDPAERLEAMIAYQIKTERILMSEERCEGIFEAWERREANARAIAKSVCAYENEAGIRAFPTHIVPDRIGPKTASLKRGRSPRKAGSTVRGRRPRGCLSEVRA